MRASLSEKKIVIILFVMVFITFSFAHEDSKKLEQLYGRDVSSATTSLASFRSAAINKTVLKLRDLNLTQDRNKK